MAHQPVGRFWDRLRGRDVTPRYLSRLTKEEQASEQKWRTVGTIRRYILLLLTLAQTVVATWYMKTILPYQGWAFINPTDMMGQDLWVSFMQLLPYILQSGILLLFAVLFCWVSAGFWTALMGFLQLLMGRDKYSISASTVGDEPLNPEHRTALIMPICNEDVDRVFAGPACDLGVREGDRQRGAFRRLHPERQLQPGYLRGGTKSVDGADCRSAGRRPDLLPSPPSSREA